MTKEEFAKKYSQPINTPYDDEEAENEVLSDLNSIIRDELIEFCRDKIPAEWIGDEVVLVEQYLNEQR